MFNLDKRPWYNCFSLWRRNDTFLQTLQYVKLLAFCKLKLIRSKTPSFVKIICGHNNTCLSINYVYGGGETLDQNRTEGKDF